VGISTSDTGATRKAVVIEVSKVTLGLLAAGLAAAATIVWNTPTDFARRDAELLLLKDKQATVSEAVKEIPQLKQDLNIVKYRVDELKNGQQQSLEKLDRILQNQRTVGGTQ
jgi:hypothetical protein